MSQHDYILDNESGAAFRADLNQALAAIATNNSASTAPATTYAYQFWVDTSTTPSTLRIRDGANASWVVAGTISANLGFQPAGNYVVFDVATGAATMPTGSTAQRPSTATAGQLRFNNSTLQFEGYNGTSWAGVGGAGNAILNRFSGTGSQTVFTLTADPGSANSTHVVIGGVYQLKSTYTVNGTTLTFSSAPPAGTNNIEVTYYGTLPTGVPSDGSISTAKVADGAVTPAKLSTGGVYWDASGNVGIGTSSPVSYSTYTYLTVQGKDATNGGQFYTRTGDNSHAASFWVDISGGYLATNTNDPLIFRTNGTDRARIDSSGNLLVGTNSSGSAGCRFLAQQSGGTVWQYGPATSGSGNLFYVINSSNTGVYLNNNSTAWAANSDERLKTDLKPIENAVSKVQTLRAVTGRYISDEQGTSRSFLIAQDVQKVLPEAIVVQPDEQGTLGLQYTDIVPLLVAAVKELKAEIDALKAQLNNPEA